MVATVDTDVLIVGAGPVGLFLANECARRDLRYRVVETRPTQSTHSKALAIFPRTMEIFDMAGIVNPFLEVANKVTKVAVISHGRSLAHMPFTPDESPYSFVAMVPQDVTEKLLVEQLQRKGGTVEYQTEFISASQQSDHVEVVLNHQGQSHTLTTKFVVGCDGAHSAVRHLLNLPFEGAEYQSLFILADIETNNTLPADELQLCPSEFGPVAIFPMSATRRRIVATVETMEGDAPSLELVRQVLAQRAPKEIEALKMYWSSYFRIHHRQVAEMRKERMFIAGDAAHIHSPFGGQGMNTGLHDVWNLVWKLDLALKGYGNDELLNSYSTERRPVIKGVIEATHTLTQALGTSSKLAQVLRDAVIPMVSRLAPFQHAFVQRLSELGIVYEGSPIIEGEGKRYFDESLRGGDGIRSRFLLLVGKEHNEVTEATLQLVDQFSNVVELRTADVDEMKLIRPDGYIAFSGNKHHNTSAIDSIRSLLETQLS
jgi:2-polyprenyl-6-methoxyphenol hydroxylase-like FAD-dependent oxidoreductase